MAPPKRKRRTNLAAYNAARYDGHASKRAIWAYVSANPGAQNREIARAVCLGKTTVTHHVGQLLESGVLVADYLPSGQRVTRSLRARVPLVLQERENHERVEVG